MKFIIVNDDWRIVDNTGSERDIGHPKDTWLNHINCISSNNERIKNGRLLWAVIDASQSYYQQCAYCQAKMPQEVVDKVKFLYAKTTDTLTV